MRLQTLAVAALIGLAPVHAAAAAGQIIRCTAPKASQVEVTLDSAHYDGVSLSCINGDFVSDMTPCAPLDGWSMSRPTGNAGIIGLARRWQDYIDHVGGVVGFRKTTTAIYFDGGYKSSEFQKWMGQWLFTIDRVTGVGKLSAQRDGASSGQLTPVRDYTCNAVTTRF